MNTLIDRIQLIKCGTLATACCVSTDVYVAIGRRGRTLTDAQLALEHHAICCANASAPALAPDECARMLVTALCDPDHIGYVIAADEALKVALMWGGAVLPRPVLSGLLVLSLGLSAWSISCAGDELAEDALRSLCLSNAELSGWLASLSETMRSALKPVADLFGMDVVRDALERCCVPARLTTADELLTTLPHPAWWSGDNMAPTLQAVGLQQV